MNTHLVNDHKCYQSTNRKDSGQRRGNAVLQGISFLSAVQNPWSE
uniref:Uncharacterized protein n=1 Tax=Anguilla anguilla TaxID=7936 RepID=A0A0E9RFZ7_ANGAN